MREKLETLPLSELKELAKSQKIKGCSTMRKKELIDVLCREAEAQEAQRGAGAGAGESSGDVRRQEPSAQPARQETAAAGSAAEPGRAETAAVDSVRRAVGSAAEPGRPETTADSTRRVVGSAAGTGRAETAAVDSVRRAVGSMAEPGRLESAAADSTRRAVGNAADRRRPAAQGEGRNVVRRPQDRTGRTDQMDRTDRSGRADQNGRTDRTGRADQSDRYDRNNRADQSDRFDRNNRADQSDRTDHSAHADQADRSGRPDQGERPEHNDRGGRADSFVSSDLAELDSGIEANGILEVMPDGFGFIRCENFLPGDNDVYVAPSQIRRFNMKTGDIIQGSRRIKSATEKFAALLYVKSINGYPMHVVERRPNFEDLTPIFPNSRLHMEMPGVRTSTAMRVLDLLAPIGKGQRGMIVSPPKAGKTTLLKQVAQAITTNHPDMHLIILLIDERPEEVTDIKESVVGENVEVIYSTFDELPDRHKRVSEMVNERAKRLVEHGRDVIILLDSITRLARAYNLVVPPSGRTLSGGLDPAALHMPKRFFGAARNMREGGSLTILATALVDTGSRMDDVIYEEFKGTGNMELVLDRKLSEKRIFPAIDILKSGTRRDDLLLTKEEADAVDVIRKATNTLKPEDAVEKILDLFARTRTNREFVENAKKIRFF